MPATRPIDTADPTPRVPRHEVDPLLERARAAAVDPLACPVAALAREFGAVARAHAMADLNMVAAPEKSREEAEAEGRMARLQRRLDEIEAQVPHMPARSAEGALAHIMLAYGTADQLLMFGLPERGVVNPHAEEHMRVIARCLYSVRRFIEGAHGVSFERLSGGYRMPDSLDPFASVRLGEHDDAQDRGEIAEHGDVPSGNIGTVAASPFRSVEAQLLDLNREYEAWNRVFNEACAAKDDADEAGDKVAAERARHAIADSNRARCEVLRFASGLVPSTTLGFGLRARLVADVLGEWWDDDEEQDGEMACRALLDHLMSAAGLARIPRRDLFPERTMADLRAEGA